MAPKYQQLAQYLREQIEAGAYAKTGLLQIGRASCRERV